MATNPYIENYKDPAWDEYEQAAAAEFNIPMEMLQGIRVAGEKSNNSAVSPAGAKSVYQFIEPTRNAIKQKYGVDAWSRDPAEQARAAAALIAENLKAVGGDKEKAFGMYHGGPDTSKWGPVNEVYRKRTMDYLSQVGRDDSPAQTFNPLTGKWEGGIPVSPFETAQKAVTDGLAALGQAQQKKLEAEYLATTDKASAASFVKQKFGMDLATNGGVGALLAEDMQRAVLDLRNARQRKENFVSASPVTQFLSAYYGDSFTSPFNKEIAQAEGDLKFATDSFNAVGQQTRLALQLTEFGKAQITSGEVDAAKALVAAETNAKVASSQLQGQKDLWSLQRQTEQEQRAARAEERAVETHDLTMKSKAAQVAKMEASMEAGVLNEHTRPAFEKAAEVLGQTPEALHALSQRNPKMRRIIGDIATEGNNPVRVSEAVQAGLMSESVREAYNKAYGPKGYLPGAPNIPRTDAMGNPLKQAAQEEEAKAASYKWGTETELIAADGKVPTELNGQKLTYAGRQNPKVMRFADTIAAGQAEGATSAQKAAVNLKIVKAVIGETDLSKVKVTDEEVLNTGAGLVKKGAMTSREFFEEIALFYTAVVDTNNQHFRFEALGLPKQDSYTVQLSGQYRREMGSPLKPYTGDWQSAMKQDIESSFGGMQVLDTRVTQKIRRFPFTTPPHTEILDLTKAETASRVGLRALFAWKEDQSPADKQPVLADSMEISTTNQPQVKDKKDGN